ncbi:hypothetical protein BSL78_12415 [Apostichopus japonicus]|uniref:Uncharacterized protein n=1 Tax=Stichopus japonicus TaxID=307972 RepID=A0A2G8KRR4_STIJA|nr:hypothetical protein BSL78_12415 [Apostichopus japonicus]
MFTSYFLSFILSQDWDSDYFKHLDEAATKTQQDSESETSRQVGVVATETPQEQTRPTEDSETETSRQAGVVATETPQEHTRPTEDSESEISRQVGVVATETPREQKRPTEDRQRTRPECYPADKSCVPGKQY